MSLNDGLALIRRHLFQEALPLLAAEVRRKPDDPYAAYYLAFAFVGAKDPAPAVTLLSKVVEAHPEFIDAHNLLGLARIRTSDFAGATAEYQAVLNRQPNNPPALLGLGMIHYWRRETALADDLLDRALRADPAARDALVFKADLRFADGQITAAVDLMREARRLKAPSLPEVSELEIADRLMRYEAALQPLKRARSGLPFLPGWVMVVIGITLALTLLAGAGLPGAWFGLAHYQEGKHRLQAMDYSGCAGEMVQAVADAPSSPKAWAYEAYCYMLDQDLKAGLGAWSTALDLDPHITLDTRTEQLALLAKIVIAKRPPAVKAR